MADDIVERLRQHAKPKDWHTPGHPMNEWVDRRTTDRLCEAAADEIERLRGENTKLRNAGDAVYFLLRHEDRGIDEYVAVCDAWEEACRG